MMTRDVRSAECDRSTNHAGVWLGLLQAARLSLILSEGPGVVDTERSWEMLIIGATETPTLCTTHRLRGGKPRFPGISHGGLCVCTIK
mmetsp:Transcript_6530/g.19363  ORF Transcript_6530/g.19363 Transcript_6530/m.19363 type:complete len:88 (+) Transcript_6530:396-659(+)